MPSWAGDGYAPAMSTVAIVLATDPGRDFESGKYVAEFRGRPLLAHVLDDVASWPIDRVVVVLGHGAGEVAGVLEGRDVDALIDPEWQEGLASPVRAALDLMESDRSTSRVVIARGDQPGVTSEVVGALVTRAQESRADAVVPKYRYALGWPVVLARPSWSAFLQREGDLDVHGVIAAHLRDVEEVWIDRLSPPVIESPSDLPSRP